MSLVVGGFLQLSAAYGAPSPSKRGGGGGGLNSEGGVTVSEYGTTE